MAHNHNTGNPNRDAHRAGNVGAGNVGVGTTSTTEEQIPAPPPAPEPTPEPAPEPYGPIVSDDRDAADAGEVK